MGSTNRREKPGRKCMLCNHPKREVWNESIAMGKMSMSQVAQQLGINKSSVSRHFHRHLQPAIAAAGGGATLAWNLKEKSRELTERMESLVNVVTRDSTTGKTITKAELLEIWPVVRAMGAEMREWMRLHGHATGELVHDTHNNPTVAIQIVMPTGPSIASTADEALVINVPLGAHIGLKTER